MQHVINIAWEKIIDGLLGKLYELWENKERYMRLWLILLIILCLWYLWNLNFQRWIYIVFQQKYWVTTSIFSVITIVFVKFFWPLNPEDIFLDDFKYGVSRKKWVYSGNWSTDLDSKGRNVLCVTKSAQGGMALPCINWTDYEILFDVCIENSCAGWIIHTTDLTDGVLFLLRENEISFTYRRRCDNDMDPQEGDKYPLGLQLDKDKKLHLILGTWYQIHVTVYGLYVRITIKIDGIEHLLLQRKVFFTKLDFNEYPAIQVVDKDKLKDKKGNQFSNLIISYSFGSFGFRCYDQEKALFRNVRAYRSKKVICTEMV